ncbi:hypothetical protein MMC29_006318 [Sticta canariensis]|nr:hypothetical protein [Sticta canariensis]
MKPTTLVWIFASAISSATRVGVTISIDKDHSLSSSFDQGSGTCHGIGPVLDKQISSIAPDAGVVCAIFDGQNCNGDSLHGIFAPGISDLGKDEYDFDKKASSIICSVE